MLYTYTVRVMIKQRSGNILASKTKQYCVCCTNEHVHMLLNKRFDIDTGTSPRAELTFNCFIDRMLKLYFIWICCVYIVQLTLIANIYMVFPLKMLANQIAVKQGQQQNNTFGPGLIVLLLIGPLIEISSLILSRSARMLQGL